MTENIWANSSVSDRHSIFADPDPTRNLNVDPNTDPGLCVIQFW